MKLDPYINVDPGTMNPNQHGEVFVTDDGAETDLDLGHYERFTSATMSRGSTTSRPGRSTTVIGKERRGEYLGSTVQVIPHITDEIKARVLALRERSSTCSSSRSAARSATSSRCRSSRRSASSGSSSGPRTR